MRRAQSGRDCSDLDLERACDRPVVEIGEVAEKDGEALTLGQSRDPGSDLLVLVWRTVRNLFGRKLERIESAAAAFGAKRSVSDHPPEPGLEWPVSAEGFTVANRLRESILDGVARSLLITDDGSRHLREVRVALPVEELQVFESGAFSLHCLIDVGRCDLV